MPTRLWSVPSSSSAGRQEPPPEPTGFLLVDSDPRRARRLMSALQAPCRLMKDGNEAIAYLLGVARFADRRRYPVPQAILLDLDHPGSPSLDLFHRSILSPALRLIPMIVLKNSFSAAELQEAYRQGAVSCVEFPVDDVAASRVASGLRRYWLGCNLPPAKVLKGMNGQ